MKKAENIRLVVARNGPAAAGLCRRYEKGRGGCACSRCSVCTCGLTGLAEWAAGSGDRDVFGAFDAYPDGLNVFTGNGGLHETNFVDGTDESLVCAIWHHMVISDGGTPGALQPGRALCPDPADRQPGDQRRARRNTGRRDGPAPKDDGFILYPNHQGMFDVLAILWLLDRPVSVVLKKELQNIPFLKQVFACLGGLCA